MCQENIKIHEEDDLQNESVQNVLKQPLIVRKLLESLDVATLKQCRGVSKSWEKEASVVLSKKSKITFKCIDSVQEFLTLTPQADGLFVHIKFNFDVETEAKSIAIQDFLGNHAKHIRSVDTPISSVSDENAVKDWVDKLLQLASQTDDKPAIIDENANYVQPQPDDESNLQEVVIHEEVEVEETKCKSTTSSRKAKSVHFSIVENPDYVPIPYNEEGYENFADFYPYYLGEHSHATGRRLHFLGITSSIFLIMIGTFTLNPILYAIAIVQAYALAVGSHYYFDKHIPKPTIKNPIYMVMGNLKMWWEMASGQRAL